MYSANEEDGDDREKKKMENKGSYVMKDENEDMGNVEWDLDGMSLPQEGFDQKTVWLNAEERDIVRRKVQRAGDCVRQRALIVANKPVESNEQAQRYRDKIIEKYKDTVLTGKVLPNPPVRGPYGYAYIPLKEGAKPFRSKPFKIHGEKERAYLKITQDWLANGYLEPPRVGIDLNQAI